MEANTTGCVESGLTQARLTLSGEVSSFSLPGRGLVYSTLAHVLLVAAFVYVPGSYWFPTQLHLASAQSVIQQHEVLLLPALAPMGRDSSEGPSSKGNANPDPPSSNDAEAIKGIVYSGPQVIVSNSPNPDNFIQTIRQPDLANNPKLPAPLPLQPMVSLAASKALPSLAPQPTPDLSHDINPIRIASNSPISISQQVPRMDAPKLPLPESAPADAVLRSVANSTAPAALPELARRETAGKAGNDEHDVLVVDALSVSPRKVAIPPGELYGTFTVSPVGATAMGLAGGGTSAKGSPGLTNASGRSTTPYAGDGNRSENIAGATGIVKTGAGANGTGHGSSDSKGKGSGSGIGILTSGGGSGRGTGSGSSPFPSVMIQGGVSSGTRTVAKVAGITAAASEHGSYGMTIVANGANGGGFKDFGVFRNEPSYTVYLDMADAGVNGSSWALQYALESRESPAAPSHSALMPPFATSKSLPHFSPDAVRKSRGGTIVVFGVITQQGKFEKLRVMQSPDPGLDKYLLDSLGIWTFRPAEIDGAKVAVKVLLGVPVNFVQ